MQLFYLNNLESNFLELPKEESNHCIKVLRMGIGDELHLTDGNGLLCKAKIITPDNKRCTVEITERNHNYQKRNHYLHIAVAPTKNIARLEWFLEKATEIGIDEITPIICEHSERTSINMERLDKIIVSAMKQSLKAYKPRLNEPIRILDFLKQPFEGKKYVAYCEGDDRVHLKNIYTPTTPALVLIGPEGDFSKQEVSEFIANNYTPITLGDCRLRTETAALAACFFINFMNE
ncbi:MAG: 16S rRNA (uracil(1498)-N(3))-methyltransferase [Bacteroidales bacterium]|nr:16S rRNA (uracil(1498)-N(3))-methyltransferase [Bacteroidales bacterium]